MYERFENRKQRIQICYDKNCGGKRSLSGEKTEIPPEKTDRVNQRTNIHNSQKIAPASDHSSCPQACYNLRVNIKLPENSLEQIKISFPIQ